MEQSPAVAPRLQLAITHGSQPPRVIDITLPVELGRFDPTKDVPDILFQPVPCGEGVRIALAEVTELSVSRRQLTLTAGNPIRLTNVSSTSAIDGPEGEPLPPNTAIDISPPCSLKFGQVRVEITPAASWTTQYALPKNAVERPLGETLNQQAPPTVREFVRWWQQVISLLQSASTSSDFFQKAADSLVDLVGLHVGAVYLRQAGDWRPAAVAARGQGRQQPSSNVLGQVLASRQTVWHRGEPPPDIHSSMAQLEAYVAAPILDGTGQILGVLYGHRAGNPSGGDTITELEALLVEALACGVAAGLARMEQEATAIRQRVTFGQFFSPELAARLEAEPDLLRGKDAEISVLFCDIRGFSRVSERLGPAQTMDWISDALSAFSDQVAKTGGVLVDYIGDELMAMWGAPTAQPDHAELACQSARGILATLRDLDERWATVIGGPLQVGVGINSAMARVGNTGSTRKFKYGPLGNGVNIASRVRGTTKMLRVDTLITGATRRLLDPTSRVRRVCTVQVVNIAEPLDLFELDCGRYDSVTELFSAYEEALRAFETMNFSQAARLLGELLQAFPGDGPSLVLLSRAVDAMVTEPQPFSPIWRLTSK
jgi:adenylate cyclase